MGNSTDSSVFSILNPNWDFEGDTLEVDCHYRESSGSEFVERFQFIFPSKVQDCVGDEFLSAIQILSIAAASSYYKAFCSKTIEIVFPISKSTLKWTQALFDEGLREFRYRNNFALNEQPSIVVGEKTESTSEAEDFSNRELSSFLIPIGGGKDSATTLKIVKELGQTIVGFSVGDYEPINRCAQVAGVEMIRVTRTIDTQLFKLNEAGAPNGHIPVTAVNSSLANIAALALGFDCVVMSNESSADEPTRISNAIEINHQWSKSSRAESLLRQALFSNAIKVEYFSLLRNLTEYKIFELFSDFEEFHEVFTSCNRAFQINEKTRAKTWCLNCDKCRFVFLGLSAFKGPSYAAQIFGRNMFDDKTQVEGFNSLLGIDDSKPFECVGTAKESRTLARNALIFETASQSVVGKALANVLNPINSLSEKIPSNVEYSFVPESLTKKIEQLRKEHFQNHLKNHLTGKRFQVVGLGRDTAAIIRFLSTHGSLKEVELYLPSQNNISKADFDFLLKENNLETLDISITHIEKIENHADVVFVSPGISKYSPEIAKLEKRATTPLAWWLAYMKIHFPEKCYIGVTGTKGKSTTASMLAHVLDRSLVAGNLGHAVGDIELEDLMASDYVVLEMSSYQSSYLEVAPDVVAVTSLFDCHIDWHLTPENYRRDKLSLALLGPSEIVVSDSIEDFAQTLIQMRAELGYRDVVDVITLIQSAGRSLRDRNEDMVSEIVKIVAPQMDEVAVMKRLSTFEDLKHRQEEIAEINGVKYISDVLSTAPNAVLMGVDDFAMRYPNSKILLLCGGANREVDLTVLRDGLNDRKENVHVVTLPETGHMVESELANFHHCDDLAQGVKYASTRAKSGDLILLAPGAPSFHRYKNYEELAAHFKELVEKISNNF